MGIGIIMRKAVFLDRDGVINHAIIRNGKPHPPSSLDELSIFPDIYEDLIRLRNAGFLIIIVTNQPDVARGIQTRERVEEINLKIKSELPVDKFLVCYHDDKDSCTCRKPKPGSLLKAAREFGLKLTDCFMVGDRWRDIEAGIRASCKTILVDYRYPDSKDIKADYRVYNLHQAVDFILKESRSYGENRGS